jgi:excisionase family DNA binding protein
MDELLTTRDLAKRAKVTDGYIRQCLLDGSLRGEKLGGRWLIRRVDAERWLRDRAN